MKKKVPIVLLVIAIAIAAFLSSGVGQSLADALYPDLFGLTENNQPKLQVETPSANIDQSAQTNLNRPDDTLMDTEETKISQKGGDQVKELVQRWKDRELKGSGWVHFVYKTTSAVENGVILPDGGMMPRTYEKDGWYFLNDQGLVEKDVVTLKDDYGNVLQQASFVNGVYFNFTLGEKFEGDQFYELKLDLGVGQRFSDMESQGVNISIQDTDYEGKLYKEFSAVGVYEKPVTLSNSPLPVESITVKASFDDQTGSMNNAKTIWKLTDGTEVVFEEIEIVSLERVDAPAEIIALVESVK